MDAAERRNKFSRRRPEIVEAGHIPPSRFRLPDPSVTLPDPSVTVLDPLVTLLDSTVTVLDTSSPDQTQLDPVRQV